MFSLRAVRWNVAISLSPPAFPTWARPTYLLVLKIKWTCTQLYLVKLGMNGWEGKVAFNPQVLYQPGDKTFIPQCIVAGYSSL